MAAIPTGGRAGQCVRERRLLRRSRFLISDRFLLYLFQRPRSSPIRPYKVMIDGVSE